MICPRCKKPIADHDAGRETAACVAEVVMGMEQVAYGMWSDESGLMMELADYSTSWAEIESVSEAMILNGDWLSLTYRTGDLKPHETWGWFARFRNSNQCSAAITAPLAVCRAALSAMAGGGGRD